MADPTYIESEIKSNPAWELAFTLSEIQNDNAPIGWGKYIYVAEYLLRSYEIKRKQGCQLQGRETERRLEDSGSSR